MSLRIYEEMHRLLFPIHNVMLPWVVMSLAVPLYLALCSATDPSFSIEGGGADRREYYFWLNSLRVVWIWLQGWTFALIEHAGALYCTWHLERVQEDARQLVFAVPQHRLLVADVMHIPRACRTSSLRIPATPFTFAAAICIVIVSAVPWLFVRFHHAEFDE